MSHMIHSPLPLILMIPTIAWTITAAAINWRAQPKGN